MKNEIHDSAYEVQLLLHGFEIPISKRGSWAGHARQPGPHPEEITAYIADGDMQQQKARGGRIADNCTCMSMKAQGSCVKTLVDVSFSKRTTAYLQGKMNFQRIR